MSNHIIDRQSFEDLIECGSRIQVILSNLELAALTHPSDAEIQNALRATKRLVNEYSAIRETVTAQRYAAGLSVGPAPELRARGMVATWH